MLEQLNEKALCEQLCAHVKIHRRPDKPVILETPFTYPDGDHYPLYLSETRTGGVRISDGGHTLMHLSYENDVDKFFEGTRRVLLDQVVGEQGVKFDEQNGQFYIESPVVGISEAAFKLGQALSRVYDLTFLNRSRVASTFYDDLQEQITNVIPEERVKRNCSVQGLPNGEYYPVDFLIESPNSPQLFLFGIPTRDKARLTTIFLQYYLQNSIEFDSLLVFENQEEMPRSDLARLSNVGGEMIASLNAEDDFRRKLRKKAA